MITKREKLQYIYVFLTDIAALAASVILAWLIVGGIMGQLLPYSVLDWVQALVLLGLAYTVTFFCFDQTENIVKRTRGQEAKLSIKSNLLMVVIDSAFRRCPKRFCRIPAIFWWGSCRLTSSCSRRPMACSKSCW